MNKSSKSWPWLSLETYGSYGPMVTWGSCLRKPVPYLHLTGPLHKGRGERFGLPKNPPHSQIMCKSCGKLHKYGPYGPYAGVPPLA